jgi:hypothetical protein
MWVSSPKRDKKLKEISHQPLRRDNQHFLVRQMATRPVNRSHQQPKPDRNRTRGSFLQHHNAKIAHRQMPILGVIALAGILLHGCGFDPPVSSGTLTCTSRSECPPRLFCSSARVCCAPGDDSPQCLVLPSGADAANADAGASSQGGDARPDNAGDIASDPEPPVVLAPPRRLLTEAVDLMATTNSCTDDRAHGHEDRWCAFTRGAELWVLNVNKAMRIHVSCDGTDPGCLLLTKNFTPADITATSIGMHPSRFFGDLLIFSADAKPPIGNLFSAGQYAWYPGWPSARRLTSADGLQCGGATWASAAWCIDRVPGVPGQYDLIAGFIGHDGPALVKVKRSANPSLFAQLSKDGQSLLFHEVTTQTPGPLWLAPTMTAGDPSTHVTIDKAVPIDGFELSADAGNAVYFVRASKGRGLQAAGTLSVVDLHKPTEVVDLAPMVNYFAVVRAVDDMHLGVAALQNRVANTGVLKLFLGLTQLKEITIGITSDQFSVSRDGRFTLFQPLEDPATGRRDARVANHDAASVCALQKLPQTQPSHTRSFTDNGEIVMWEDFPDPTQVFGEGWAARAADCGDKHRFGNRVAYWRDLHHIVLLIVDEFAQDEGVIRFVKWGSGTTWPASGPVTIQNNVRRNVDVISPSWNEPFPYAVYTSHKPGGEGLYVAELPTK